MKTRRSTCSVENTQALFVICYFVFFFHSLICYFLIVVVKTLNTDFLNPVIEEWAMSCFALSFLEIKMTDSSRQLCFYP